MNFHIWSYYSKIFYQNLILDLNKVIHFASIFLILYLRYYFRDFNF